MLQYRAATPNDIPTLLKLEQCVVAAERPFNNAIKAGKPIYYDLPDLIRSEDSYLLVVEDDDSIVATGYGQIRTSKPCLSHDRHCYLGFMYVAPAYRGKGLNQEVMQRIVDWSQSRNVSDFYLDVYYHNDAAIRAYQKFGFESSVIEMKLHR